jgi:hypothetical protein
MRGNLFLVCSVCDKIGSAYAQHTHATVFEKYSKYHIKMQILTRNNRNFQKPSSNPSNRAKVKILKKKIFWIAHQKNFVPRVLSHLRKCSNIKILAKIEGKEAKFFSKIYEGHIRI